MQPLNLLLRFCLELAALGGFFALSLRVVPGGWRWPVAVAAVVLAGALWAIFAVPDDPSRSGAAPVAVRGWVRLVLEWAFLLAGAACLWMAGFPRAGAVMAVLVVVHYALWPERIAWLLQR